VIEIVECERMVKYWGQRWTYFTRTGKTIAADHAHIVYEQKLAQLQQAEKEYRSLSMS